MIFFVLFFPFLFIKIGSTLCFYLWNWVIWPECLLSNPLGWWWWWCCRRCCCFLSAFFCFFCSTIFKHICLFLSLSACISRVPFFWSVHIFLSTWIKRRQNKPKTQNQLDSSYIPFCRILCFAFNFRHNLFTVCTLDIGFIPLYTQCIFHIHFVYFFLFVWKVLCACFLLTTTDTKFMNTIEMYFVFFLSLLNWRGKKGGVVEHDIPLRSKWAKWITH